MRLVVLILVAVACFACDTHDPKSVAVPPSLESWQSDEDLKEASAELTDEDKRLFGAYAIRSAMASAFGSSGIPAGTTIGSAIEVQRRWEAEQKAEKARQALLKRELESSRLAHLREMNDALTVSLLKLGFRDSDPRAGRYSDQFLIEIGFENRTDQELIGAKGVVVLKDVFGDTIKRINLSNDTSIQYGETHVWSGTMDYNQFRSEDKKLRTTPSDKLNFEWEPVAYLFEDGTRLEMP